MPVCIDHGTRRHPGRLRVVVPLALTVGLVGCGGSAGTSATTDTMGTAATQTTVVTVSGPASGNLTARQVAAKLRPLGCRAKPASTSEEIGIKPVTELQCRISGEDVSIAQYRNAEQLGYELKLLKGTGCQLGKQFGITDFYTVMGQNWAVSPDTSATAQQIDKTIGGAVKLSSIHC